MFIPASRTSPSSDAYAGGVPVSVVTSVVVQTAPRQKIGTSLTTTANRVGSLASKRTVRNEAWPRSRTCAAPPARRSTRTG